MKLLVIDYAGHPFQYDLSTELGARGHSVTHTYSSSTATPHAGFETAAGVTVTPVSIGRRFERYRLIRRLIDEVDYGVRTVALAHRVRPDRVLASNVPVVSLVLVWVWATLTRTRWVLWLQDIQSGLVGLAKGNGGVVARVLRRIEYFLIMRASHVVTISDAFRTELVRSGLRLDRVTTIENWAPLADMPARPRRNDWSCRHGLDEKFVFLYSGTLGLKHSPHLLVELADEFTDDAGVEVVVVAEGVGADWLRAQHNARVTQLPFQPFECLPDVLASADVLVVLLDESAGAFSVPSKTLSYLCAGRAILGAVPNANLAAEVITSRAMGGVVVDPADAVALRRAARVLYAGDQRTRYGRNAREYALAAFDRRPIADRFEVVLQTGPSTGRGVDS